LSRLTAAIGRQLHYPSGICGRLIASTMIIANRVSNRIAINALEIKSDELVLELGCGSGYAIHALDALRSAKCVFGIDHSMTMLKQAARLNSAGVREHRIHLLRGRVDALPLSDNSIDKVLGVHVVYFANETTVREVYRVLCRGGRLVLVATEKKIMKSWGFDVSHRLFEQQELAQLLVNGGFAAEELQVIPVPLMPGVRGLLAIATKGN
jgi:ubiquinone/menaquinone biosynthesis C-methylase UbiE